MAWASLPEACVGEPALPSTSLCLRPPPTSVCFEVMYSHALL